MTARWSRRTALVTFGVFLTCGASAELAEREERPWLGFAGHWVRMDREADDAARRLQIEAVTASMSFVTRGVARMVMARAMRPPETYSIEATAKGLAIAADAGDPEAVRFGAPIDVTEFKHEIVAGGFDQVWRHGESTYGTTSWRLSADRRQLSVTAVVHDGHFDGPVRYATHYRRRSAGDE